MDVTKLGAAILAACGGVVVGTVAYHGLCYLFSAGDYRESSCSCDGVSYDDQDEDYRDDAGDDFEDSLYQWSLTTNINIKSQWVTYIDHHLYNGTNGAKEFFSRLCLALEYGYPVSSTDSRYAAAVNRIATASANNGVSEQDIAFLETNGHIGTGIANTIRQCQASRSVTNNASGNPWEVQYNPNPQNPQAASTGGATNTQASVNNAQPTNAVASNPNQAQVQPQGQVQQTTTNPQPIAAPTTPADNGGRNGTVVLDGQQMTDIVNAVVAALNAQAANAQQGNGNAQNGNGGNGRK